jgi:hypothetical protein
MAYGGMSKSDMEAYADKKIKEVEVINMNAKQFLADYAAKEHADDPNWASDQIKARIKSVGGLLTEEGATLVVAQERGWANEALMPQIEPEFTTKYTKIIPTEFTELTDQYMELIYDTTAGQSANKYPKEPLVGRVIKIYSAEKPKFGYADMHTTVKLADNMGNVKYFDFLDVPKFANEGKIFPQNNMSTAIQLVRAQLVEKVIAIYSWQIYKSKSGKLYLSSTAYTKFDVIDESTLDNNGKFMEAVPGEEVFEELVEGI